MNKPKFTTKYTAMINRAAAIAKKEGGDFIGRCHIMSAIFGMAPKLFHRLLGVKQLIFAGELPIQGACSQESSTVSFSSESIRVLSLYGGLLGRVVEATGAKSIDIGHVAGALLLDDSTDSPVRELLAVNGITVDKAAVFDELRRMSGKGAKKRLVRDAYRAVADIRNSMNDKIVGQKESIERVCGLLLQNWLTPLEERLTPLVISIEGKSGSGKSLFATTLSSSMANYLDTSVTYLNGGDFASENTAKDWKGYDSGWKGGPRPGRGTKPVMDNPKAILVVENFELLHNIARSHLLRAITTGRLEDDMVGQEVDFRQSTIILISSAGCNSGCCDTASSEKTKTRLVEELTSGIVDSDQRDNVAAFIGVSSEIVLMKDLTMQDLQHVFVRALEMEFASITRAVTKNIHVDVNRLADVLMEGISSQSPGDVAPMVKAKVGDPVLKAIMESNGARVESVEVEIDSGDEVDVSSVAKNLAMRRRRLVTASASFEESRIVLHIKSGDFVLLPALCDGFIRITPPKAGDTFAKLVGLDKPIEVLRRGTRYLHGEFEVNPGGFMFVGASGTGKSCLARAWAYEAGVPYVQLNCAELISPEAITNVFNKLRLYGKGGLIAIFDEIDAIGGERDDNKSAAYIERLNLLLENIDGIANDPESRIVYVGLTNRMQAIDGALLRDGRFGRVINFRGLDVADRRKLLDMEIAECGITPAPSEELIDLMARTTNEMPGSMLKAIVHELAFMVSESEPLTREMYAKARIIVMHGEGTTTVKLSDEQLLSCAVHEAGHALACEEAGRDFNLASIVEDDPSRLGCVEPAEKTHCTGASILASIDIALAGLAGQEVMGLPPSGGGSDLHKAKELAFDYIRNGFCREWGLLYLEEPDEKMMVLANKILDERYSKVSKMLLDIKPILSRFAKMLAERKMLFHDDLRLLKKSLTKKGAEYGNEV